MIHTIQLSKLLDKKDLDYINSKFNKSFVHIENEVDGIFTAIKTTIRCHNNFTPRLYVTVDIIKIFGKSDITEDDYCSIEQYLNAYSNYLLGVNFLELTLIRIDYRIDVKISNENHRKFLLDIYRKKTIDRYKFKEKNNLYKSSVYYNNKSVKTVIYDKEKERIDKDVEPQEYEKSVIRFECAVLNKHLNGNKYRKNIEKELRNYFRREVFEFYMQENFSNILYRGDYYTIDKATIIIRKSELREKEKIELREFLKYISVSGIEKAKFNYSKYKFKKFINQLDDLNINPILIPRNRGIGNFFKNPFKISENYYVS